MAGGARRAAGFCHGAAAFPGRARGAAGRHQRDELLRRAVHAGARVHGHQHADAAAGDRAGRLVAAREGQPAAMGAGGRRLRGRADRHPARFGRFRLGRSVPARRGLLLCQLPGADAAAVGQRKPVCHPLLHRPDRHADPRALPARQPHPGARDAAGGPGMADRADAGHRGAGNRRSPVPDPGARPRAHRDADAFRLPADRRGHGTGLGDLPAGA